MKKYIILVLVLIFTFIFFFTNSKITYAEKSPIRNIKLSEFHLFERKDSFYIYFWSINDELINNNLHVINEINNKKKRDKIYTLNSTNDSLEILKLLSKKRISNNFELSLKFDQNTLEGIVSKYSNTKTKNFKFIEIEKVEYPTLIKVKYDSVIKRYSNRKNEISKFLYSTKK